MPSDSLKVFLHWSATFPLITLVKILSKNSVFFILENVIWYVLFIFIPPTHPSLFSLSVYKIWEPVESTLYQPTIPGCVTNMWSTIPLKKADSPSPGWNEMSIAPWLGMRFHGYLILPYWDLSVSACTDPEFIHASALLHLENTFHWIPYLWLLQSFQPTLCIDPEPPGKELLHASHLGLASQDSF